MLLCLSEDDYAELNTGTHLSKASILHCNVRGINREKAASYNSGCLEGLRLTRCQSFFIKNEYVI